MKKISVIVSLLCLSSCGVVSSILEPLGLVAGEAIENVERMTETIADYTMGIAVSIAWFVREASAILIKWMRKKLINGKEKTDG